MTTHQEYSRDSYPANKKVLQKVKGVKGHLLCRIYWATNLKDRVCRMGLRRLGAEIGFSRSAVSRAAQLLVENNYIIKVKNADPSNMEPAHYLVTQKFFDLLKPNTPVAERDTPVAERDTPVAERDTPVAERDKDIDIDIELEKETTLGGVPSLSNQSENNLPKQPDLPKQIKPAKNTENKKTATKSGPPPKTQLSELFTQQTGIKQPKNKSDISWWWNGINRFLDIAENDIDIGIPLMIKTIKTMKERELTISDPNSLIKMARAAMSEDNPKVRMKY